MIEDSASSTHHRWSMCALLFFAATINYMDRQVIGLQTRATVGSISGGWLSSSLLRHGGTLDKSRKTALLASALAVVPVVFADRTLDLWLAVAVVAVAAGARQGWSANMYTLAPGCRQRRRIRKLGRIGRRYVRRQSRGIHPAMDRI